MRVNVLVGGPVALVPQEKVIQRKNEQWVAADYGATRLLNWGIKPAVAIGDFDSTSASEFQRLREQLGEIETFPPEKDFTDTQLGVKIAIEKFKPDEIDVFGATGGRIDHLLANLFLPLQAPYEDYLEKIHFIDRGNTVAYYRPGSYEITKQAGMKYLAFVNLTPVKGLTLVDEKYPLDNWSSDIPVSWSSNEFVGTKNHFSFTAGVVAVIQCCDQLMN
ncbi:thiamine diphosphokinase [Limosilactobacillus viscerum]|uniref:thiamine diphosphokinase n=1 Tax=Limosilactobacillus viscerum TaxID=2993450 RepID=UPI0024B890C3|nr:thiamine diphosphokinase [Limosilactobacillus viscerum]